MPPKAKLPRPARTLGRLSGKDSRKPLEVTIRARRPGEWHTASGASAGPDVVTPTTSARPAWRMPKPKMMGRGR